MQSIYFFKTKRVAKRKKWFDSIIFQSLLFQFKLRFDFLFLFNSNTYNAIIF